MVAPRSMAPFLATASVSTRRCRAFLPGAGRFGQQTTALMATTSSANKIRLRNATIQDLDLIVHWDEKPHLTDPNVMGDEDYNDWNWEVELKRTDLSWRFQLIAELSSNGKPIGVVQVLDPLEEETHYWGEDCHPNLRALDIWIGEEEYLGQGYGSQMMNLALEEYCFSDPLVEAALVDPMAENPRAHQFYQRIGFVPEGIRYFGPDKCLVHRLTREDYYKKKEVKEQAW